MPAVVILGDTIPAEEPQDAVAYNNHARALLSAGRYEEAISAYERALARRPNYALAHNNLANVYTLLNRSELAIQHYREAIRYDPDYAEAHNNLGSGLQVLGQFTAAIASYECAIHLKPDYIDAHYNLGLALANAQRLSDAIREYRTVLQHRPAHADAHYSLAVVLAQMNLCNEAITHYHAALALKPNYADCYNALGNALVALGRFPEAHAAFERAIQLEPRRMAYHRNLANCKRFAPDDHQLAIMKELAQKADSLPEEEQIELHITLGKAHDDLREYEASFHHYESGNRLKRAKTVYHERETLELFDSIQKTFTRSFLQERRGLGNESSLPIFIVGMPRSGTTLVEQILASHPGVYGAGELSIVGKLAASLRMNEDGQHAFTEFIAGTPRDQLASLGQKYIDTVTHICSSAQRITDKLPYNFLFLGLINVILPNARVIHVHRDPFDTCFACFTTSFARGHEYTFGLEELGRYYKRYENLMSHWRRVLPPNVMLEVGYEDLVANIEANARAMIKHCGLAWDDRCLQFYKTNRPVRTASAFQVRQPVYSSSVGRSQPYREFLRPLIDILAS